MTQTREVERVPNPGNLPDTIERADFSDWEVITSSNIDKIIEDVQKGNREPLNMMCLPYTSYLTMGGWEAATDKYIKQAETMLRRWKELYDKSLEK